jgi:hypothetical protein
MARNAVANVQLRPNLLLSKLHRRAQLGNGVPVALQFSSNTLGRSRWMATDPQQRRSIQTGPASKLLFVQDNPKRCQDGCLSTCRQLRSLFAQRSSAVKPAHQRGNEPSAAMTCAVQNIIAWRLRAAWLYPQCNPFRLHRVQLEYTMPAFKSAAVVLFLLLSPALLRPQTAVLGKQSAPAPEQQTQQSGSGEVSTSRSDAGNQSKPETAVIAPSLHPSRVDHKIDTSEGKQTKRMFGVIPNFAAVSAHTELPPLTTRGKFWLATQDSVDYSSFVWAGMQAGQSMALKSYPELGHGAAGYSRYYWRAFADQASGSYFTEAIVPALTHEDPRYYTLGHGGFFRRARYALSRVVLTRTDSGGTSFNFSEILGNGMEAGLANLYYPPQERSLHNTAVNWASQLEAASLNNLVREFWPDIRHKFLRQE